MANLSESSTYEAGIYQLERTDAVDAGVGGAGVSNTQAKQLANRTKYLKDHVDAAEADIVSIQADVTDILNTGIVSYGGRKFRALETKSANYQLDSDDWGKLFRADTDSIVFDFINSSPVDQGMTVGFWNDSVGKITISDAYGAIGPSLEDFVLEPGDFVEFAYAPGTSNGYLVISHQKRSGFSMPGTVMAFAGNTPPLGWLACNGAAVSQTTYDKLYAVVGSTFSYLGAVSPGNFRLPDLRGEFIRGWDNSRGVDSGRVFGSEQADELEAHTHLNMSVGLPTGRTDTLSAGGGIYVGGSSSVNTASTGGSETRPRNVALLYCIKY